MVTVREVEPGDAPGIARVHVDSWRTTYRGILPDAYLADLSYGERAAMWERILAPGYHGTTFVAVDDGRVVGFANGGAERSGDPDDAGELYALYLLDAYQGQGVGRRLMQAVARGLADRGMTSLLVWVAARNPTRHFYERLGGRRVRTKEETIGGATIEEIAYCWDDTAVLVR